MQDIFHWVRLHLSGKLSGHQMARLREKFSSMKDIVEAYAESGHGDLVPEETVEKELEFCKRNDIHTIVWSDRNYPALLKQVHSAPCLLWAKGNVELLNQTNIVSIVGSRNASLCGIQITKDIVTALGENNFVTISGLAKGIDTVAHQESLSTGTIAVLGTGMNVIYPRSNRRLFNQIAEHGVLVTELPHHLAPHAKYFPIRNRIIAGMSIGMVVTEAKKISGSMLSARYAFSYGRKVMAVPGSPLDERSHGCLQLIKEGAMLINDGMDVIQYLRDAGPPSFASPKYNDENSSFSQKTIKNDPEIDILSEQIDENLHEDELSQSNELDKKQQILNLLSITPTEIDHIVQATKLPVHEVQAIICELLMSHKIVQQGCRVYLRP